MSYGCCRLSHLLWGRALDRSAGCGAARVVVDSTGEVGPPRPGRYLLLDTHSRAQDDAARHNIVAAALWLSGASSPADAATLGILWPRMFADADPATLAAWRRDLLNEETGVKAFAERVKTVGGRPAARMARAGDSSGGIEDQRALLHRQAERKFGTATTRELAGRLAGVTDAERLALGGRPDHRLRHRRGVARTDGHGSRERALTPTPPELAPAKTPNATAKSYRRLRHRCVPVTRGASTRHPRRELLAFGRLPGIVDSPLHRKAPQRYLLLDAWRRDWSNEEKGMNTFAERVMQWEADLARGDREGHRARARTGHRGPARAVAPPGGAQVRPRNRSRTRPPSGRTSQMRSAWPWLEAGSSTATPARRCSNRWTRRSATAPRTRHDPL